MKFSKSPLNRGRAQKHDGWKTSIIINNFGCNSQMFRQQKIEILEFSKFNLWGGCMYCRLKNTAIMDTQRRSNSNTL